MTPSFGFCKRLSDFDFVGWLFDLLLLSIETELLLTWPAALVTGYWPRLFLLLELFMPWALTCLFSLVGFLVSSFNNDFGIRL